MSEGSEAPEEAPDRLEEFRRKLEAEHHEELEKSEQHAEASEPKDLEELRSELAKHEEEVEE